MVSKCGLSSLPKIAIFRFDDSPEMVLIFEELRPTTTSEVRSERKTLLVIFEVHGKSQKFCLEKLKFWGIV